MKKIILRHLLCFLALWMVSANGVQSQESIYLKAMQQEVLRGMEGLVLDQMLTPSFISYHLVDANTLYIQSVLGGIVVSRSQRMIPFSNRILVMRDGVSNENLVSSDNLYRFPRFAPRIPLTDNTDAVRRALWLETDRNYKSAVRAYETKVAAIRQQNLSEEERALTDFLPHAKEHVTIPYRSMEFDKQELERMAMAASGVFADYASIVASQVDVLVFDGEVYYHNSEGTIARYPFQIAALIVKAATQIQSGEVINEYLTYFAKDISDFPKKSELTAEVRKIAEHLQTLSLTEPITEVYVGPVLFEGQAVAEVFSQVFFRGRDQLAARRTPIVTSQEYASSSLGENSLETRIGNRIISRDLSVIARPRLEDYLGIRLVGSFGFDAEGVVPPDSIVLIEDGILRTLLSARVPTPQVSASNGHARLSLEAGGVTTVTAPGVVQLLADPENAEPVIDLREKLLQTAREEGLEYAYIVRKMTSPFVNFSNIAGGSLLVSDITGFILQTNRLNPIKIYRVYVEDGREELVSLTEIKGFDVRSFRRILGAAQEQMVYNTMLNPGGPFSTLFGFELAGLPVTFITPEALLFEEIELVRETQRLVKTLPPVASPVGMP